LERLRLAWRSAGLILKAMIAADKVETLVGEFIPV
jgi:hypothetical protein